MSGTKTNTSNLRHLTIEETYELGDAILDNDWMKWKGIGRPTIAYCFYAKIEVKQMILI
jgi:XTP/dITP diphosphohydrolase